MLHPPRPRFTVPLLLACCVALQVGGFTALASPQDMTPPSNGGAESVALAPVDDSVERQASPTTTAPPTTVAPTTTTAPPPPPPPPPPAPLPAPAPPAPAPAPVPSPAERVRAAFESSVPAVWRAAIPVRLVLIDGSTSWADHNGDIRIGSTHYNATEGKLRAVLAHEFGHLIAFRYGSQAFNGAGPSGWPSYGSIPAEAWADCVSQAFTGVLDPSHGLSACSGSSLSWTVGWLAAGPAAYATTGW